MSRKIVEKICMQCGLLFSRLVDPVNEKRMKYCSYNCNLETTRQKIKKTPEERFLAGFDIPEDKDACWLWKRSKAHPSAIMSINNKSILATRFSYEYYKGKIPIGIYVCHSCDNPKCVNPKHLWLGSCKDNMDDMRKKGRQKYRPGRTCKLKEEEVVAIKNKLKSGAKLADLAKEYHVGLTSISFIKTGRNWKHIII